MTISERSYYTLGILEGARSGLIRGFLFATGLWLIVWLLVRGILVLLRGV